MRLPTAAVLFCLLGLARSLAADATLSVLVRDQRGETVPDAVVSLFALGADLPPSAPPAQPVEIAQQDQEFIPYVTAVRVGTVVEFPNRDDIQHHLYSLSKAKRFEKPLHAPGARERVLFDQAGVVTLGCNIHDWMVAYILVLATDHYAQTGPAGSVSLSVPAGRYRVEVWHPRLGAPQTREFDLAAGVATEAAFELRLRPDRRIRRAPETKTGPY